MMPGRLPLGRMPWDPVNGARVGAVVGALVGAALIALSGLASFWLVAACGVIGGAIGYRSERRGRLFGTTAWRRGRSSLS